MIMKLSKGLLGPSRGMGVVRITVSTLLIIHGVARISLGIVDDFGGFFAAKGIPMGEVLAWTITIVEIAGGLLMAIGFFVVPLATWFVVQLAAGIVLVHAKEGWFVVGAGRNGVEYSVLLIAALIAVSVDTLRAKRTIDGVDEGTPEQPHA